MLKAFEELMEFFNFKPSWQNLNEKDQKRIILKLMDQLDLSNKTMRMRAARCVLYLAQGCWAELQSDQEQADWARKNVMMLYELGIFNAFVELLNLEIE